MTDHPERGRRHVPVPRGVLLIPALAKQPEELLEGTPEEEEMTYAELDR